MRILLPALVVLLALATAAPGATLDTPLDLPTLPSGTPDVPETPAPPTGDAGVDADAEIGPLSLAGGAQATIGRPRLMPEPVYDALAEVGPAAPVAVAAVGGLAMMELLGVARSLAVGAFAGYTRLTRAELLDNEHRDGVYKLIQEEPGIALSEIAQRSGLGWGTTVYHLDRLERAGFVASERSGVRRCFFPVGTLPKESRKGIGALKADTTRTVAAFLVERPGATQGELAEALGMSASAASKQVSKLEDAGLVRREREWKTVRLHPAPALATLLHPAAA